LDANAAVCGCRYWQAVSGFGENPGFSGIKIEAWQRETMRRLGGEQIRLALYIPIPFGSLV
jgi:hypothetical protein